MAEAMKEDGESTMDIKAVQRILDALQYQPITNSGTKHEEDRVVGGEKSETTTISQAAVGEKAISKESSVIDNEDATKSTEIPTLTQSEMQQSLVDPILKSKNTDKENFLKEDDTIESVPSSMTPKSVVRPHLEVIASDLPPLRPSSVPKRKSKLAIVIEEDDDQSKIIMEDKASSLLEEQEKKETQTIDDSNEGDIINSLVSILKQQIPGELFQRSLLKQKFEYDALARVAVVENDDDDGYFDPNNETKADEALSTSPTRQVKNILKDSESTPSASVEDIVVEEKTTKEKKNPAKIAAAAVVKWGLQRPNLKIVGSTTPKSEGKVLQSSSSDVTSQSSQLGFPPLITTTSPTIFERVSDTIVARSQPKSPDEESKLADRYASMSVEERAFAVLFDPGMIKKNKDPKDPSYDHTHDDEYCDQT
eukprot:CAMPEP_0171024346 /NCGR_PEP_ID=MMETSP0736-20130129/32835_1 /TAXON_ID=186038 /ORGANISM="Fragilariopsis kerguelensis, Strain L26-C5" /LENGTH=422 /DNA_ID=CAMNT_0011464079 /DNA_START=312 /DNA_END=1582 /DNA_ORIENTATION=+